MTTNPLKLKSNTIGRFGLTLTAISLLATGGSALAQATWTGLGANPNWSTPGNWTPGAPNPGDALIFAGTTQTSPNNNDTAAFTGYGGMLFDASAGAFILGGNDINFAGLLQNNSASLQEIDLAMVLTNATTINTAAGDILTLGAVSGSYALTKIGAGTLTMGTGTYPGVTTVSNGLLVVSNSIGTITLSGGSLMLNFRSYSSGLAGITFTADAAVGVDLLDNAEPRGVDTYSSFGADGFKMTKIGVGILRMGAGNIIASSIDVTAGTLASLGGSSMPATHWGTTNVITVENGATLRADDGGVCPNPIVLMGGDGTSDGSYTHQGVLVSGSRNNTANPTNNIFVNTITLAGDSTIGSQYGNLILSGNITGPGALTKLGANPLILGGTNTYGGDTTIAVGSIQLASAFALPGGATNGNVNLTTNRLDMNGYDAKVNGLSDDGSAIAIIDNSSATPSSLTFGGNDQTVMLSGPVKNTGGGALSLVKIGSGSATLSGPCTFNGGVSVQGGQLVMNVPTSAGTNGPVIVADNAQLSLTKTVSGSALRPSGVTLGTAGSTTLNINLGGFGNPAVAVLNATNGTGILSVGGTVTLVVTGNGNLMSVGQFPLIKYKTRTGTGSFNADLSGLLPSVAVLVTNVPNNSIDIKITSAPITTWVGNLGPAWDVSTTLNWTKLGVPSYYTDGIGTFFTDPAATNYVSLTTSLSPASVLVNSTNQYFFDGPGNIGSGDLSKSGSGTLILNTDTAFNSATLSGGTLQLGTNGTTGSLSTGTGTIQNDATLAFNRGDAITFSPIILGSGKVVQQGTNQLVLSGVNTYSGGTLVNQGTVRLGAVTALGTPLAGVSLATVANGAALDFNGYGPTPTNPVIISGPGVAANQGAIYNGGGGSYHYGPQIGITTIQLANDATIGNDGGLWFVGWNSVGGLIGNGKVLTKVGTGTVEMRANVLTSPSQVVIAGGTVTLWKNNPFGTATVVLTNNAQWNTWDQPNWIGLTIGNNFVIANNGGQLNDNNNTDYRQGDRDIYNGSILLNGPLSSMVSGQNGGVGGSMTMNGPISGVGSLTKDGPYPMILNGTNTYTGPTTINAGVLSISPVSQGGGTYTSLDGATLDVPSQTGYATVPMSTLTLGSATGSALDLTRLTALTTNAPITATNLILIGANAANVPPFAYSTPGQYPLVKYSTLTGGGSLVLGGAVRGVPGYISNNVANSSFDLVVPGGTPVVWSGSSSAIWDIATTLNWKTNGVATDYEQPGTVGDAVTFNDNSTVTNVFVSVPVSPVVVLVNTTNTYSFIGTNITGTSGLVKSGPGILVLTNRNNNFTGGTLISAGTLKMATSINPLVALNNLTGTVTVSPGATLDLGSNNPTAMVINAAGAGVGGAGAIQANYTGAGVAWGPSIINMNGNLTIGGNNRWDLRNGSKLWNVSSNGATLTKIGAGYTGLNGVTVSTNLGDITILGGTLSYQAATTGLGNTNNTIYVGNGASLSFNAATVPLNKSIICSNSAALASDGGGSAANLNIVSAPVKLDSGSINFNFNFYNGIIFSNVISGAGGINMQFQSIITMAASNTYTGNTTVPRCNSGSGGLGTRLLLIGNGSIDHSARITLQGLQSGQAYAGYLDVLGRADKTLTLGANQTLQGDNGSFVRGSVVAVAGSTITPGGASTNFQYMSISNSLTFLAGSTNQMDIYKVTGLLTNDIINVSNVVTYGGTLQLRTNGTASLVVGDAFKLFYAGSSIGNFANIADASGTSWVFNPLTGVATVTALPPTVNTNATSINASVGGGNLTMSWPTDHIGWFLQSNSVSLASPASWFNVPGSDTTNKIIIPMNTTTTNVFYRMKY